MREILFKAKRLDNGEWVEGFYHYTNYIYPDTNKLAFTKYFIMPINSQDAYEIRPDTICQYTGLTDKNGNKIWENDVLCGHGNKDDLAKVLFGDFDVIDVETIDTVDRVYGWHTKPIPTDRLSRYLPFCLPMSLTDFYINRSEYEVIGNIFDKPELTENE